MKKFQNTQTIIEQIALLGASFIWTTIVLTGITFFWAYRDIQTRWEIVTSNPPVALAQALPTATSSPMPTPWAGPGPTLTPTATSPPSPTPTRVIQPPDILPETLNPNEPTPIPVIVHTEDEAADFGLTQDSVADPATVNIQATPSPVPVAQDSQEVAQAAPIPAPPAAQPAQPAQPAAPSAPPDTTASIPVPADISPTRLLIPSVGIDSGVTPVGWNVIEKDGFEYSIWQVADYAIGWHKTTATLGQSGNTVMAGHHNVNGEVFRDLVNVEVGDRVVAYSGGQKFEYIVELKTIVKEKGEPVEVRRRNAEWISPTDDERLTFVTCWPYTNNTHRVIVVAKPV